jgi:hypothetical protein
MDGREGEQDVWNVGSEHESISNGFETKDWNCENTEAETDNKNGEQSKTGEAE